MFRRFGRGLLLNVALFDTLLFPVVPGMLQKYNPGLLPFTGGRKSDDNASAIADGGGWGGGFLCLTAVLLAAANASRISAVFRLRPRLNVSCSSLFLP